MSNKAPEPLMLMEFTGVADEPQWQAINDGVMGGQSEGGPEIRDGLLHFSGVISLANNGGFASIRGQVQPLDLSGSERLWLRLKGDGRTYQLRLYTDARYKGSRIAYAAPLPTRAGEWLETAVSLSELEPTFRGQTLAGPPFDPARVEEIGFLLGDKREGPFHLCVDWIKAE